MQRYTNDPSPGASGGRGADHCRFPGYEPASCREREAIEGGPQIKAPCSVLPEKVGRYLIDVLLHLMYQHLVKILMQVL